MKHVIEISVNGEPQRELFVATDEPIAGLRLLSLSYACESNGPGPLLCAGPDAYHDRTYRLAPRHPTISRVGTFRTIAFAVWYENDEKTFVPVDEEIIVRVIAAPGERAVPKLRVVARGGYSEIAPA